MSILKRTNVSSRGRPQVWEELTNPWFPCWDCTHPSCCPLKTRVIIILLFYKKNCSIIFGTSTRYCYCCSIFIKKQCYYCYATNKFVQYHRWSEALSSGVIWDLIWTALYKINGVEHFCALCCNVGKPGRTVLGRLHHYKVHHWAKFRSFIHYNIICFSINKY